MLILENICLRKVSRKDLKDLFLLKEQSWKTTHNFCFLNKDDQIKWFEKIPTSNQPTEIPLIAEIIDEKNGENICIGIFIISDVDYKNRNTNVSWSIYEKFRGKGYGKELVKAGSYFCFNILNLKRIYCEILSNNPASIKCAESAGFLSEGVKVESVFRLGEYLDSHMFSLLDEDFVRNDILC